MDHAGTAHATNRIAAQSGRVRLHDISRSTRHRGSLILIVDRVDQLPRLVIRFHLFLLGRIPPIVKIVRILALVSQFVHAQLVPLGVHVLHHGGGVRRRFEDGVHGHGVAEGHAGLGGLLALGRRGQLSGIAGVLGRAGGIGGYRDAGGTAVPHAGAAAAAVSNDVPAVKKMRRGFLLVVGAFVVVLILQQLGGGRDVRGEEELVLRGVVAGVATVDIGSRGQTAG
mmetsp:Transcript_38964/g.81897  ORF Transcript_38964/g.81897 Transcript_38964/m.81897 type:complete len:226 (-) Transcript_38964:623-1300(-)